MQPIETNRWGDSSHQSRGLQGVGQCSPLKHTTTTSHTTSLFTGSWAMQPIETSATCSRCNLKVFRF